MDPEAKLRELGLELPAPPKPFAAYRTVVRSGDLLFVSGMGPVRDGKVAVQGQVGKELSVAQGQEAARLTMLVTLAAVQEHLGSLAKVRRVVKCTVYVNAPAGFTEHPAVANGATELLRSLWGEEGLPARAAVGVASLPMNIPVEIESIFEVAR